MSSFLKLTIERTENKRRDVAKALLNWDKIADAIGLAAASGASKVTLTPAAPIKIRHTPAAIDAVARLTREQFRPTWTEHRLPQGGSAGDQLEIEW